MARLMNGLLNASKDTMFAFQSPKLSAESGDASASQIPLELLGSREGGELGTPQLEIPNGDFADLLAEITPPSLEDVKPTPNHEIETRAILLAEGDIQRAPQAFAENLANIFAPTQNIASGTDAQPIPPLEAVSQQETVKYSGIKPAPEAGFAPPSPEQLSSQETIKYAGIKTPPAAGFTNPSPEQLSLQETIKYAGTKTPLAAAPAALPTNVAADLPTTPFTGPPKLHAFLEPSSSHLPSGIKIEHLQVLGLDTGTNGARLLGEGDQIVPAIKANAGNPEIAPTPNLSLAGITTPFPTAASNEVPQQAAPNPTPENARITGDAVLQQFSTPADILTPNNVPIRGEATEVRASTDKIFGGNRIAMTAGLASVIEAAPTPVKLETAQPVTTSANILSANLPTNEIPLPANIAPVIQIDGQDTAATKLPPLILDENPLPSLDFANTDSQDGQQKAPALPPTKQLQTQIAQFTPTGASDTANFTQNTTVETPQISIEARALELTSIGSTPASSAKTLAPTPPLTSHVAVQQIGDALVRQSEKSGDIVIRLDPAELGKVNITFTFDKAGGVNAHVVADTASTAAILRDRADVLATQLKQSGFENVNLSFDTNTNEQSNKGFGTQFSNQSQSEHAANRAKVFDLVEQDIQNPLAQIETEHQPPKFTNGALDLKL